MTATLAFEDATLVRGTKTVLSNVNAVFAPGSITAVVGPNGAGKTTLLRALAGLDVPTHGRVLLRDRPMTSWTPALRAREVASLGQDEQPDGVLTALEVSLLGRTPLLGPWGLPSPTDVALAQDALRVMDLGHLEARRLHSLSGGEKQRVLLARVACQAAPVLILDEPTDALDLNHARAVMEWVGSRARLGDTVVVALHDLALAARFASHWVVLGPGQVLHQGVLPRAQLNMVLPQAFGAALSIEDVRGIPVLVAP